MPFTLAHVAILLPLAKWRRVSMTALIAGSMVPDFEFFLQMREVENVGHHWYGILLFDFPVGLLLCFVFHNILRGPLTSNLPGFFTRRFANVGHFNWNKQVSHRPFTVGLSLLAGILSHLLWDSFTHSDGGFVQVFPALQSPWKIWLYEFPLYYWLQLGCSFFGLMVLAVYVWQLPQVTTVAKSSNHWYYWPLLITLYGIILIVRFSLWPEYNSFWGMVMAALGGLIYSAVFLSLLFYFSQLKKSKI